MTTDHSGTARLVAEAAAGTEPNELPRRLCAAVCEGLDADGVTLSLLTDTPARQLLAASNAMALRLEEVQFTVLEGPCIAAAATGEPVLVTGLSDSVTPWPLFGASMREQLPQVEAVAGFPLRFGDYVLGSMDLLSLRPAGWDEDAVAEGLETARAVAAALVPAYSQLLTEGGFPAWEPAEVIRGHWFDNHRAVDIVAARLGCGVDDALALMRAEAFRTGQTLAEVTADVIKEQPGTP
jgi:hypothetical protein